MTNIKLMLAATLVSALSAFPAIAGEMVVIVNPAVGTLSKEQLADLYLGKFVTFTPYDLAEGSPSYADFYSKVTGRSAAQIKATWSRLQFSGKATPPKQLPDAAAMKKAVAADPKGVGYIEKSAVDSTVKVVMTLE